MSPPTSPSSEPPNHPSTTPDGSQYLNWGSLLSMGLTTAVAIAVGVLAGLLVDRVAGTAPVFLFLGLLIGIAGAVSYIVVKIRSYLPSDNR